MGEGRSGEEGDTELAGFELRRMWFPHDGVFSLGSGKRSLMSGVLRDGRLGCEVQPRLLKRRARLAAVES